MNVLIIWRNSIKMVWVCQVYVSECICRGVKRWIACSLPFSSKLGETKCKKNEKKNGAKCLNSVQLGNRFLLKSDLWAQNFRADLMDNSSYCLYDRKNSIPPSKCRWLKYLWWRRIKWCDSIPLMCAVTVVCAFCRSGKISFQLSFDFIARDTEDHSLQTFHPTEWPFRTN